MNEEDIIKIFIGFSRYTEYLEMLKSKKRVVEVQSQTGLTDLEIIVIHAYTDLISDEVNSYLKFGKIGSKCTKEQLDTFSTVLSRALKKLPPKPSVSIVRRDTWLDDATIETFRNHTGKKIDFKSFTSTTQHGHKVKDGKTNCRMEIKSLSGRDISVFSRYEKEEKEVLFDLDTVFVVKSVLVDPFKKTVTLIILDEDMEE